MTSILSGHTSTGSKIYLSLSVGQLKLEKDLIVDNEMLIGEYMWTSFDPSADSSINFIAYSVRDPNLDTPTFDVSILITIKSHDEVSAYPYADSFIKDLT
jgi:hypothetical protein